jgi:glycerol-3-phosphate dehydrogenase (NAD(P)+)
MKVTVIGAGSWGTAVAVHLAKSGSPNIVVTLCPRSEEQAQQMIQKGANEHFLPGIKLPENLHVNHDWRSLFEQVLEDDHLLIIATPLANLKTLSENIISHGFFPKSWIWLCKGIDPMNSQLAHEMLEDVFHQHAGVSKQIQYGALSGPSFAIEVAQGLPCALTIASQSKELASLVQKMMHHDNMRIYETQDMIGVELGGAIKNILAIATGVSDGLQLGLNARAALITRGMAEMTRLGIAMGAQAETFAGLTGMGDLILTATGDLSRNRKVGLELAKGKSLEATLKNLGHVAEGVRCASAVLNLAKKHHVDMPIVEAVCLLLDGQIQAGEAVIQIMAREPKHESSQTP